MQIFEDRKALHRIPELDRELPKTMDHLKWCLEGLGCRVFSPMAGALCAWFDFGAASAVAFRAGMDGLPIQERTGKPYASCHPGRMHACGHDGHMAILLELARRLNGRKGMKRNVLLVFQPAEETTGGAKDLCATGLFKNYRVEAIFGLHLWPGLDAGEIYSRPNEMMSRSCEVKVEIFGKSAHIGRTREGVDAMAAGVDFYRKVRAMEGALPKEVLRLLNFGKLESGSVCNAVSGYTRLEGTLRAFRDEVFYTLRAGIVSIGKEVERAYGCTVNIYMNEGYPAVLNPEHLYQKVKELAHFRELEMPSMITEDFSWYQRTLPGMFFFLGTGDTPALYSDEFDFPELVLTRGADFFTQLAESWE